MPISTLSGGGEWSPRRLPGLVAWFNANRNAVVLNATDEVTAWNDVLGNSVASTGTDDPDWNQNGWGQGVGGIAMSQASATALTSTAAGLVNPGAGTDVPFSLFCSVLPSIVGEVTIACWQDSIGLSLSSLRMNTVGAQVAIRYRRTDAAAGSADVDGSAPIGLVRRRFGVLFSGTTAQIYMDRELAASGASDVGALTPDTFKIGTGPGIDAFTGMVADVVVMNRLVSVADYLAYESWSRAKLGT